MRLSNHFSLHELTFTRTGEKRGLSNEPGSAQLVNLRRLAGTLEDIRRLLGGCAVIVTSGYRSPEVNAAVGGVPTSDHVKGCAADIIVPSYGGGDTGVAYRTLVDACRAGQLSVKQLIWEKGRYSHWLHVSVEEPKNEFLVSSWSANEKKMTYEVFSP